MRLARRTRSQEKELFPAGSSLRALHAKGVDIIRMGVGSPSFDTPQRIKEATKKALDDGYVHYDDPSGLRELRVALSHKLKRFNRIEAHPDSEILVTPGATGGAFSAIMSLIDEGDEAINFNPGYTLHDKKVLFAGGKVKHVALTREDGYSLDRDRLEGAVTAATKMIVLVNPHNPLGRVYTTEELTAVAKVAIEHDLVVLSDETYEYFTYDPHKHSSIACLKGMGERTISLFTFTKAFAMDGWRLGYACGPEDLIAEMKTVETLAHTHVNVFIQKGAVEAALKAKEVVGAMVREDERRRNLMVRRLAKMKGVVCDAPEGGLYVFPDFTSYGVSSAELQATILSEARVSTVAGASFGSLGEGHLRLCFGADTYERLEVGLDRIESMLMELPTGPRQGGSEILLKGAGSRLKQKKS